MEALEQARAKAEEERADAERREQEARAHVEQNLAQLQSLAVAVAKATGAAAHARAGAAAAEQLAATNAAAASRSRAAVAGQTARAKAERAAAERIAAAKAEAARIIKARNTPVPAGRPSGESGHPDTATPVGFAVAARTPSAESREASREASHEAFAASPLMAASSTPAAETFAGFAGDFAAASSPASVPAKADPPAVAFRRPKRPRVPSTDPSPRARETFAGFDAFDAPETSASFGTAFNAPETFNAIPNGDSAKAATTGDPSLRGTEPLPNAAFDAFDAPVAAAAAEEKVDTEAFAAFEVNVAEEDARDARAFPETEPEIGDFAEIAEPPAPAPPPAPFDDDGFADFSDDDEASGPAATPVPPASKVSALLKKGVTIAPPTNVPVGSDALARPSVFDAAPAPEPKPLDDASAAAAAAAAADEGTETEPERAAETAAPTAPIETTFDDDGFADFESDEEATKDDDAKDDDAPRRASIPTRTTTTHDDENVDAETRAPVSDVSSSDPMEPLSRADRARFDATFDAYVADDETGLSGAQLVQITAGAGLANADLSRMWQLVAAPGAGALRRDDFAIFCRLLSRRAAGDPLPAAIDGATRARFFADSGGRRRRNGTTTSPVGATLRRTLEPRLRPPRTWIEPP